MTCPLPAAPWWLQIRTALRIAALCFALAACALYAQQGSSTRSADLPIGARIGAMTLTGALEWRADRPDFGGFSGLALEGADGLIALTDKAHWVRTRMIFDEAGALTGLEGLTVGRLDGPEGDDLMAPFTDSEALSRAADGSLLIGFEGKHRIGRFATPRAAEERLAPLPDIDTLPPNGSFESVVALPDGRIAVVAETAAEGEFPGWLIDGDAVTRFTLVRDGWFAPTDMAMGPQGAWVYLLERRFTLIGGFAMRLRRFPLDALREGARIEATPLTEITGPPLAENYEGLATARDAAGRTLLYIISDDNFRLAQRTLLLQMRVEE